MLVEETKEQQYIKSLVSGVGGNPIGSNLKKSLTFVAGMSTIEAAKYIKNTAPAEPKPIVNPVGSIRGKPPVNSVRKAEFEEK